MAIKHSKADHRHADEGSTWHVSRIILVRNDTELIPVRFRWVSCQLDALRKCYKLSMLTKMLGSLPTSLNATYDRILEGIDECHCDDVIRVLQWLSFSAHPLTLAQLGDTLAVISDENGTRFEPAERVRSPEWILEVCSSLVMTSWQRYMDRSTQEYKEGTMVLLAHFSVKEYLISDVILRGPTSRFGFNWRAADTMISQTCLGYLLHFSMNALDEDTTEQFPLATYAAEFWILHAKSTDSNVPSTLHGLILALLTPKSNQFFNWVRLFDVDYVSFLWKHHQRLSRSENSIQSPLYYVSLSGLSEVCNMILRRTGDINAQGGLYGNALQAASCGGHEAVIQLLLENGADVNAQGGRYGNALQAASYRGHAAVIQLLLENGADVNAQGGFYGNALQAASCGGHETVIQLLLENGADVNAQGGEYGNALQAASYRGHEAVIQLLLENGADVNAQGGEYGNALQAASCGGHEAVIQLLLENGADVNAQGGFYGNALQAASCGGHEAVIQLLLENGADVNAQGGEYGNALQAASYGGHEAVIQLLLENGADVNAQGGLYGNALEAASDGGYEAVIQLLLENDADVNAQGGTYGNGAQAT